MAEDICQGSPLPNIYQQSRKKGSKEEQMEYNP